MSACDQLRGQIDRVRSSHNYSSSTLALIEAAEALLAEPQPDPDARLRCLATQVSQTSWHGEGGGRVSLFAHDWDAIRLLAAPAAQAEASSGQSLCLYPVVASTTGGVVTCGKPMPCAEHPLKVEGWRAARGVLKPEEPPPDLTRRVERLERAMDLQECALHGWFGGTAHRDGCPQCLDLDDREINSTAGPGPGVCR